MNRIYLHTAAACALALAFTACNKSYHSHMGVPKDFMDHGAPAMAKKSVIDEAITRDTDGDGVPDWKDNCPNEVGTADNYGCMGKQFVTIERDRLKILDKVYFATGSDQIEDKSFELLGNIANVMKVHTEIAKVRVEGHTDNTGEHDFNVDLSKRRAAQVMSYLLAQGVTADRLDSEGYGPDKPVADNDSDDGRAANRRVEFVIVKDG